MRHRSDTAFLQSRAARNALTDALFAPDQWGEALFSTAQQSPDAAHGADDRACRLKHVDRRRGVIIVEAHKEVMAPISGSAKRDCCTIGVEARQYNANGGIRRH